MPYVELGFAFYFIALGTSSWKPKKNSTLNTLIEKEFSDITFQMLQGTK